MGFVADKIKAQSLIMPSKNGKQGALVARARASGRSVLSGNTEELHDLLAPYLSAAIQAWVDGLEATKLIWNQSTHRFEDSGFPDHKVRSDCAQKIVEYLVGKAIERSMEVSGSYQELSELLAELEQSPEARRLLSPQLFASLQKAAESESSKTGQENSQNTPENGLE